MAERVEAVRATIAAACARAGRDPGDVRLIAATKTIGEGSILAARSAGVADFAENYAKELARKARAIPATWHFVGKLQAGTAASVADAAAVVHSAEPGTGLERVAGRAARRGRAIDALVQVDFTGQRQGVDPEHLRAFVDAAEGVDGIRLIGLMTLPPQTPRAEGARPYFARLRDLRDGLLFAHPDLVELSMGMSADYAVAVEEGATMVRVGTALFGARPPIAR